MGGGKGAVAFFGAAVRCWDCGESADGVCLNEHRPGAYLRGRARKEIIERTGSAWSKRMAKTEVAILTFNGPPKARRIECTVDDLVEVLTPNECRRLIRKLEEAVVASERMTRTGR